MQSLDLSSIAAGFLAYGVSILLAVGLVFTTYRVHMKLLARPHNGVDLLLADHRPFGIALGASILSQAVLLRHAVFPTMAVVRDLFLTHPTAPAVWRVVRQCALFWLVVGGASFVSVLLAARLFTLLTGRIKEREEIVERKNFSVAIYYVFALLAITVILNEGIEDLSRSLVPYGPSGVIQLP